MSFFILKFLAERKISIQRLFALSVWLPILLLAPSLALAQSGTDSTKLKYNITPTKSWERKKSETNIDLVNPIQTEWKYNPKTNRYEEFMTFGGISTPTGQSLSVMDFFKK